MSAVAMQVCDVCVPDPSAAASLLADALGPVEWAVFKHVTSLLHEALTPPAASSNGLTASALAALLAEVWFSKMPTSYAAAGQHACQLCRATDYDWLVCSLLL